MAKKVLVKDNKVLSLHSGKVLGAPENYDLDTYLNFYMPFGGTITLRRTGSPTVVELEYSLDGGATWTIWQEVDNDRTLTLPVEGRVWIRNTSETSTGFSSTNVRYYNFITNNSLVFADGNVMSLLCKNPSNAILSKACFFRLFYINNKNLVTPPKIGISENATQAEAAFNAMFYNCQSLWTLPVLHLKNVSATSIYGEMAIECRNLIRIVTYMEEVTGTNALYYWVRNVQTNYGDFYCPAELTIPTGVNGIPDGWTRHDLSELE